MNGSEKIGYFVLLVGIISLCVGVSSVGAETITSPSYKINGNLGGSFGGQTNSTNYKMSAIGGEAIVGSGSSGSYIIDQRQTNSAAPTMELSVQPAGLVGYYPMDENAGTTTADASQYQNNGTLNTTAGWYANGMMGSAVDMNGATDSTGTGAVLVPDHSNLPSGNAMTVAAWVDQDAWYGNQAIASHWSYVPVTGGSGSWALQTGTDNNLRIFISSGPGDTGDNYVDTAANTWDTYDGWRHVAMVYDGTQAQADRVKVYIDGIPVSTTVYGTLPSTLSNSTGDFSIGSFPGLGRAMTGAIDNVKIFNRAFTRAEAFEDWAANLNGSSAGIWLNEPITGSVATQLDAIVRTNTADYSLAVQQDHDLQTQDNIIPAISGNIASPITWSEGVTKGWGFTLTGAPTLDGKWNSGAKYAAVPSSATTFYSGTGHVEGVVDVINLQLRLDAEASLPADEYRNTLIYTGTAIP